MLLNSSKARGARGNSKGSRGSSRGRGQAGRGASNNSFATPSPSVTTTDPFEKERLENAAKREQRAQNGTTGNNRGRGSSRGGLHSNKQVRFATPPIEQQAGSSGSSANATPSDMKTPFDAGTATPTLSNPFSTTANTALKPSSNIFGAPTKPSGKTTSPSPFAPSSGSNPSKANGFGSASTPQSTGVNPFAPSNVSGTASPSSTFGTPSSVSTTPLSALTNTQKPGILKGTNGSSSKQVSFEKKPERSNQQNASKKLSQANNGFMEKANKAIKQSKASFGNVTSPSSDIASFASSSELASKIDALLRKEKISPPRCSAKNPGDPRERAAV
ncbi:hypothetical protein DID88_006515 [Monilinia fructigena]|uniref:Uncharacterized protein n=1 Tax=Monilinia fructigena TaxID=38457 RepID=A0A395IH73_9HELO|nr:hypothetical protein DID88_006515 [Monilinia fructigena]